MIHALTPFLIDKLLALAFLAAIPFMVWASLPRKDKKS